MTTHRYPPPPPLPPPPPPANRQYHVHYSSPAHSSHPNYYSSSQNYIISQDRRRSSFAREGRHSPIKEQKTTYESYPQQQRRRRSSSPQPTNSSSPQSSESHSPDMASQRPTDQKKTTQTAKRAAQNRAAQRAFRQRRERYVKDLEIRVKEMDAIQEEMNNLVEQNTSYRKQIDNLTREVKQLKEAGQSFTPYASGNKHVMTPKSPPPPPPPVQQPSLSPTEPEHKQNAPRFTSAAKDANNQLKGSSFEAEMARRLNHSDHTMNQDSASYSESLYSLQQRRGMTSPRKPSSNNLSARTDDYQFPIPTANVEQKNINSFNHSNGHVHNSPLEGRKDVPATSQPNAPGAAQSKPMPNGNVFVSSGASPMMDHPYPLPPRSDVGILPTPVYSNEPRFIHQFGDIDHTNPGLVGMIDMPPLSMGEGEFEMEDPFAAEDGADDLDFAPEDCDRILDDLVTILQQRNRPQIPHNLNPNEA